MIDHSGIILPPERHEASRLLLNSTLAALDDLSLLGDWDALKKSIEPPKRIMLFLSFVDKLLRTKNDLYKRRFLYVLASERSERAVRIPAGATTRHIRTPRRGQPHDRDTVV